MTPDPTGFDIDDLAERLAAAVAERLAASAAQRFLGVKEAARFCGLSPDAIRGLVNAGRLTGFRPIAGRVLVDKRELESLILSSTRRPRRGRGVYERLSSRDGDSNELPS
jgi:hypothetical protein